MCANHEHEPEADFGPRYFVQNWRQPGPLSWKLKRLIANNWIKLSRRQHCCGNAGEPGC